MLRALIFRGTLKCNLRCPFCYEATNKRRHASEKDWRPFEALEKSCREFDRVFKEPYTLIIHGGEPTLFGAEGVKRMFDIYRASKYADRGKLAFQTNLYNVSDELIKVLAEYKPLLSVSYDGRKSQRLDIHGNDVASIVRENILRLKAAGVTVNLSVTPSLEVPVGELVDDLIELGCNLKVYPPNPIPDGKLEAYTNYMLQYYREGISKIARAGLHEYRVNRFASSVFRTGFVMCDNKPCQKLCDILSVDGDGSFYACSRLETSLGNIFTDGLGPIIDEFYNRNPLVDRYAELFEGACKDCPVWPHCHGGCPASANTLSERTTLCDIIRGLYYYLIYLSVYDKKLLEYFCKGESFHENRIR